MATTLESKGFPASFTHPATGPSTRVANRLAIRWAPNVTNDRRNELLTSLGLEPITTEAPRPGLAVNRTDGLWWVHRTDDQAIDGDLLARVTASELVQWAAPAYRADSPADTTASDSTTRPADAALFTVNPTRLYVRHELAERAGGVGVLAGDAAPDDARGSRLPGMVAITLSEQTSLQAAEQITAGIAQLADAADTANAVRFETVPFLSPTTTVLDCRPPSTPFIPRDPLFAPAWGLARIEMPDAWQIARASTDLVIAVIDTGVELAHPDLDVHPQSWNASDDTPNGSPTENHGTACAGIAAARLDNGAGVSGVAGGARIMAIATATWADTDIAEGLYFAADNGARVVSMSFGVYPSWGIWDFDLIRDALQYAHDKGLVLVAAAGNEDQPESRFPGSDSRTICVGGSNRADERKRINDSSAETFWGASWGPDLDVVAPCLEIPTTDRLGGDGYDAGDYTLLFNGTSAATPHVAGLAALILSVNPALDRASVRHIIELTCDKISPAMYPYANVPTKPSGTWHAEVGYGRVNAERALLAACATLGSKGKGCGCDGCGGCCGDEIDAACRSPRPIPWLVDEQCQTFYEARTFEIGRVDDNRRPLEVRVSYEHRLCLLGRQQGPLLYTVTLLPGETQTVYEFDRYRRVRQQSEQVSVHSSFRQTMSALSQSRRFGSASTYTDTLTRARVDSDTSVSAGGGLAGFFGAPQVSGEVSTSLETTVASGASTFVASEQFVQNAVTAAQSTDAERTFMVSSFEDAEHQQTTQRTLSNPNHCYAVTYFVRRVLEVYGASSYVVAVEWRLDGSPWRNLEDLDGAPDSVINLLERVQRHLPRVGDRASGSRRIALPTDGALYESELAHCSSCEPLVGAQREIDVELARLQARRLCLETELLELELDRRRRLAAAGSTEPLELPQPNLALNPATTGA